MAGRFSVEAVFKAVDRVTAPVSRMQNRVGKFTRSMKRGLNSANRAMARLASGIKRGAVVIAAGLAITTGAMANVMSTGADFEQAIVNVGAVSLKTRDQIAALEKQALQLGRTTKFTSTQAANAMEILAKAGFSQQDILTATPAVLSAAAASGLEIAEVADHVSNVLKGMGLETSEAARVADVLALASARTNSTIGSLGESMKNVAQVAQTFKIPLEEVIASVALLQDVGLEASVAGSATNTMLTKLAALTPKAAKKLKKLGVEFQDANGDMLPFPIVLGRIGEAMDKAGGNMAQVGLIAEAVGLRGQKAAIALAKLAKSGKFLELKEQLEGAAGAAEKMADLRMDTVKGSLFLLNSAVDATKVKIFGLNGGPLKDVIDQMTAWVTKNEDFIATGIGDFLGNILSNLTEIANVFLLIAKGVAAFLILAAVLKVISITLAIIAALTSPIGLIVLAIAGLVALGAALIAGWDPVKAFFVDLWETIKSIVKGGFTVADKLGSFFNFSFGSDSSDEDKSSKPQMISPGERTAKNIDEQRSINSSEVTIKDESGRAEVTKGELGPNLKLQTSGGF